MTVPNKHGLYCVGLGATTLGGITRQSLALGSEVRGEANSGEIYSRFLALYSQRQAPGFTTNALRTALTACGASGADVASMSGGMCLYAQKHADGSTRTSGSAHRKYAFTKGILAPRQLTVSHRGDAELTYEAVVVSADGTTNPLTITDSSALPTVPADGGRFSLGPLAIGGVTLTGYRQLTIDFGIDVIPEGSDGEIWDTFASIRAIATRLTFRGIDTQWLKSTNVPTNGLACAHADTELYLRKRAVGATFVADGIAEHIKITACGMATVDSAMDASGSDAAECTVTLATRYDGTNAPLIITLDQGIS